MNINELKEKDPARFEREYAKWRDWQCSDSDWWEFVEEGFKEDMEPLGVDVSRIFFSLGYGQGDYASFSGHITVADWLESSGYAEQYPAFARAISDYFGSNLRILDRYKSPRVDWDVWALGSNTAPSGVFSDLPQDAWEMLVHDQENAEDWEGLLNDWLRDKAHDLYKSLRDEYEYQTSEEQFIESCECNEVEFDDEGEEE